jgi:hypothetical protein
MMSDLKTVQTDIQMIVGGHFSPAAVGPQAYEAVLTRVRSQAAAYLDAFEQMFVGANFDPQAQSNLYMAGFLKHLRDLAPDRVRALTQHLLKQYDAVLVIFDQVADKSLLDKVLPSGSADFLLRLNDRRDALRRLVQEP